MTRYSENTLFVYRNGDADSLALARHYKTVHNLSSDQIAAINCSSDEILADYDTFKAEVEDPIKSAISSLSRDIYVIVIGLNVPGGFYDGPDIIAATSRLSRINHTYYKTQRNFFYDRKEYPKISEEEFTFALICARIDAPTLDLAKKLVNYSEEFSDQYYVNGRIYYDRVSNYNSIGTDAYRVDLDKFYDNLLYDLNLTVSTTEGENDYVEVVTPYLQHDSFYWGWSNSTTTQSFFKSTDTARVFFYNADGESAITLRDTDQENFGPLAITAGYIAMGAAMSDPTVSSYNDTGFLRPFPFFDALNQGASIGEAFMRANPYLDWTVSLIGDPLVTVEFPENSQVSVIEEEAYTIEQIKDIIDDWRLISKYTAEVVAAHWAKEGGINDAFLGTVFSHDIATEVALLYKFEDIKSNYTATDRKNRLSDLVEGMFLKALVTDIPKINTILTSSEQIVTLTDFLDYAGLKISRLFLGMTNYTEDITNDTYYYDEGYFEYEQVISLIRYYYDLYHFTLTVSDSLDFSNIVLSTSTEANYQDWKYEEEKNEFITFPQEGVPAGVAGRRIRYESPVSAYLDRGTTYYFKLEQTNGTTTSSFTPETKIIYT